MQPRRDSLMTTADPEAGCDADDPGSSGSPLHDDGEPAADGPQASGTDPSSLSGGFRVILAFEDVEEDPALEAWLSPRLSRAAALLGIERGHLSVAIVNDDLMGDLHERHAGVAGTTDVLTFDLREPGEAEMGMPLDGEVILCLDEATRQASQRGHAVHEELLLYGVHGLLHLLGYDDAHPDDFKAMHEREGEILAALQVGPVFGPINPPPP